MIAARRRRVRPAGERAMRSLRLALRALRREWRSGELAVLWLSLSVAAGALMRRRLPGRSHRPRGGPAGERDAGRRSAGRIRSADSRHAQPSQAHALQLATAQLTTTLSAIFLGDANQLADVRAVERGLSAARAADGRGPAVCGRGADRARYRRRGEAWPDSRLAAALGCRASAAR